MNDLIENFKKYLKETLGIEVSIFPWKGQKQLPFFLVDTYAFFELFLLNHPSLLMISQGGDVYKRQYRRSIRPISAV